MRFSDWEIYYKKILSDFNFNRNNDELSAMYLSSALADTNTVPISEIRQILQKKKVIVLGGYLPDVKNFIKNTLPRNPIIVADSAVSVLLNSGIIPEIIITDLDGKINDLLRANEKGSIVVVHAHGDNLDSLKRYIPKFKGKIFGTTQAKPLRNVHNFGGFTDGDRCVFLATHFKAYEINLVGFDFSKPYGEKNPSDYSIKLKKLKWAKKLIFELKNHGYNIKFQGA